MTDKVYIVTDLGPGDGGKGGVVHKISHMMRAHTIIKRGGAQGSHGVCTSRGEKFNFSQWGCGTFEGVSTHLSGQMIISPEGLLNEAAELRYRHGISEVFDLLTVDETALCATPFHGIASRIKELALGKKPRGTIGTGVGEAYREYMRSPEMSIVAGGLKDPDLRDRLVAIRQAVQTDLQYVIEYEFLPEDRATLAEEVGWLYNDEFLDFVVRRFEEAARQVKVVSHDFLGEVILRKKGVAVIETSHGVLTDRYAGFHPHTSAIRTLPSFTGKVLDDAGYEGQVVNLGVTRAYAIRHGAGPMPTADPRMADRLLPGSNKDENRYQGKVRVGAMDMVLLRYAVKACGGPTAFDGLAISWFDQISANACWDVCHSYSGADDPIFFSPSGEMKVRLGTGQAQLEYQAELGTKLNECTPQVTEIPLEQSAGNDAQYDVCAKTIQEALGVPVRMVSFGPTEVHKLCK